jgi:hypothetical protein
VVAGLAEEQIPVFITNLSTRAMQPGSPYGPHARHLDERISAWAKDKQTPFLSLLPVMAAAYEEKPPSEIVIEGDGHPTAATHALIEAALRPWLGRYLKGE